MTRVAMAVAAVLFVIAAASTAILAVPFMNPDNLAYQAWGAQLRGGELPTVANALTTPHPAPILLMAAIGGIVSPLATWAALAIAGLVAVVAGAVLVAWRRAGATGAGAALLVLGFGRLVWIAGPLRGIDWLTYNRSTLPPATRETWERAMDGFFRTLTRAEVAGEGRRRGINATVVNEPADVLADPHLAARQFFVEQDGLWLPGRFVAVSPGPPIPEGSLAPDASAVAADARSWSAIAISRRWLTAPAWCRSAPASS